MAQSTVIPADTVGGLRLLHLLPAIYQESAQHSGATSALRALLAAIESVLLEAEPGWPGPPGLASRIDAIPELFKPIGTDGEPGHEHTTPREFLSWLAQWVAVKPELTQLLLQPALEDDAAAQAAAERAFRNAIARIVPLYALRGTRGFLEEALRLFIPETVDVQIDDRDLPGMQVGRSAVGKDSWLVTYRPFHFSVRIRFAGASAQADVLKRRERKLRQKAETIIELSKPAHTVYDLRCDFESPAGAELDV